MHHFLKVYLFKQTKNEPRGQSIIFKRKHDFIYFSSLFKTCFLFFFLRQDQNSPAVCLHFLLFRSPHLPIRCCSCRKRAFVHTVPLMALHANPCQLLQITITDTTAGLSAPQPPSPPPIPPPPSHTLTFFTLFASMPLLPSPHSPSTVPFLFPGLIRLLLSFLSHLTFPTYFPPIMCL